MILSHTPTSSVVLVTSNSTRFFLRSTSAPTEPLSSSPSRKRCNVAGLPSLSVATFAGPAMATQSGQPSPILFGKNLTTVGAGGIAGAGGAGTITLWGGVLSPQGR